MPICDDCGNELNRYAYVPADCSFGGIKLTPPEGWQWGDLCECNVCRCFWWYKTETPDKASWVRSRKGNDWTAQYKVKGKSQALWIAIKEEFERQQPPMTVRQMFYRMSSAGVVDKTENGYRQVQYALATMRRAGAIPYNYLADNTRWVRQATTYSSLANALEETRRFYRRDLWQNQPCYVEIWLEKDALSGVISSVTNEYGVPLYVTRGYPSITYLYDAAESLRAIEKPKFIYHFGDYDASGQDAARSIKDGLHAHGAKFEFIQFAVTPAQINNLNLQTRPSKKQDPRAARHGDVAVELDAIEPTTLRDMVRMVIEHHIDPYQLEMAKKQEAAERSALTDIINAAMPQARGELAELSTGESLDRMAKLASVSKEKFSAGEYVIKYAPQWVKSRWESQDISVNEAHKLTKALRDKPQPVIDLAEHAAANNPEKAEMLSGLHQFRRDLFDEIEATGGFRYDDDWLDFAETSLLDILDTLERMGVLLEPTN